MTTDNHTRLIVTLTTFADTQTAERIGEVLINEQLAACIQLLPIQSIYRWKGVVEKSAEVLCIIKSKSESANQLKQRILELHPYTTPEIVIIKADDLSTGYWEWINSVC
ncbi:MAG TPA: divalent cation tolerance protein CutA [Oligoflexia bacterium]|nr:divalent cation tolerance protein CutA [Oligoflexia bacterium]HMP26421.1 divalent cation tolerance protein CutA [Oligoflexia bacterium]